MAKKRKKAKQLPAPVDDPKANELAKPAKRGPGQPSKLTPKMLQRVDKALRRGLYRKDAAKWAGISRTTFCSWLSLGKAQKRGKFREFLDMVLDAEQETKNLMLGSVLKAAAKDWKAAAWWLERKFPLDWGKADSHVAARRDLGDEAAAVDESALAEFRSQYIDPKNVFVPHELQRAAINCTSRYMAIVAGVGGGKTRSGAINCWNRITSDDNPQGFYLLVAPDTVNGEVMCEHFVSVAPRGWVLNPKGRGPSYARTWDLRNGARAQFRSADKPEKIVARRANGIWVDEFTLLRPNAWRVSLRGRLSGTGAGSLGWAIFTGTPRGRNWAYEDIWRRTLADDELRDDAYRGYTWPSYLNPAVDPVDVEEARRNLPASYFDREWKASWEAFHGQIYSDWSEDRYVVKGLGQRPLVSGTVAYMSVDWGFAKPGALLVCRRLPDGMWHAVEEVHEAGRLEPWWTREIAHRWGRHRVETIWCDPEDPQRIGGLADEGMPARAADNQVSRGIRHLAGLICQGRFLIDSSCTVLRQHLAEYHWRVDQDGKSTEEPDKVNDHICLGAGALVETERGPVAIEDVRAGDRVWTRSGLKAVLSAGCTGFRDTRRLRFSDGSSLVATADHPILTGRGWIRVDALRYDDKIAAWPNQKRSSSTGSRSGVTPTRNAELTASTIDRMPVTSARESAPSTSRFGRQPTDRCRVVTTSTTGIGTRSTTRSRTSSASPRQSTTPGIHGATSAGRARWSTSQPSGHLLPSGTAHPREGSGTGITEETLWRDAPQRRSPATTAVRGSSRPTPRPDSTPTLARQQPATHRESTTKIDCAPEQNAESPSGSIATRGSSIALGAVRLLSIGPAGKQPVFNLEVEGAHEFVANGILVHNCDCARYITFSTETDRGLGVQVTRGGHAVVALDQRSGVR